jgi:hypothetical protein
MMETQALIKNIDFSEPLRLVPPPQSLAFHFQPNFRKHHAHSRKPSHHGHGRHAP